MDILNDEIMDELIEAANFFVNGKKEVTGKAALFLAQREKAHAALKMAKESQKEASA